MRSRYGCMLVAVALLAFALPVGIPLTADLIEEIRIHSSYRETQCTVLEAHLHMSTTSGKHASGGTSTSVEYHPRITVGYAVDGQQRTGQGFASRNYESDIPGSEAEEVMRRYVSGKVVPCYYDPRDPKRVVLVREWGDRRRYLLFIPILGAIAVAVMILVVAAHDLRNIRRRSA